MLSGVGIICFAASYSVALVLEITRLLFRSGVRGAVMLGFAGAGLVAHTAFLYHRAVEAAGSPLSSEQDWYLLAAWALVVVYLYLVYYHPRVPFGLFLLPLALGLIAAGTFFASPLPVAQEPASQVWGFIHGVSILLATIAVLMGFMAGLMYLGQARRLKRKRPPLLGLRLPSLEWLEKLNSRAIVVALLMVGVGVVSGMVLNAGRRGEGADSLPWHDPVVLATIVMFFWLLIAVVVGAFYRPARMGRKVAYLTLVSFVFLTIALVVGLALESEHWETGARGKGVGARDERSSFPRFAWERTLSTLCVVAQQRRRPWPAHGREAWEPENEEHSSLAPTPWPPTPAAPYPPTPPAPHPGRRGVA